MTLPIASMLKDVELVEKMAEKMARASSSNLVLDLCCHVKALANEVELLKAGYEMMLQIVSDRHKWHCKIARAVIDGKDMRKLEDVESLTKEANP